MVLFSFCKVPRGSNMKDRLLGARGKAGRGERRLLQVFWKKGRWPGLWGRAGELERSGGVSGVFGSLRQQDWPVDWTRG